VSPPLKLGFVPLTDAAPLIVARELDLFGAQGVEVELVREVSWATVRDKLGVGALDAAQLLAPLAVAASLGIGCRATSMLAPTMLNRGGAAVTLSSRIAGEGDSAAAVRRLVARRREQGASRLTFAVVFPFSTHHYLLRRWLAAAGVDPDADVRITVAPPGRMAELLAEGVIEGFCAGEPWSAAAVDAGAGAIAARVETLWPDAPDKVLAIPKSRLAAEPERLGAVVRAVLAGASWADDAVNHARLVEILARPEHVGASAQVLAPGLAHVRFAGAGVNTPWLADAEWLLEQMAHAGQLPDATTARRAALDLFQPELA
jgi:NitT/TauT family transport system ATP-binding protein/nitrate/nitrite transport system substrate-binding protein